MRKYMERARHQLSLIAKFEVISVLKFSLTSILFKSILTILTLNFLGTLAGSVSKLDTPVFVTTKLFVPTGSL